MKKRAVNPTTQTVNQPTPGDQLLQITIDKVADRKALMADAVALVKTCLASAPVSIDQTGQLFEALMGNNLHGPLAPDERRYLVQLLLQGLFSSPQIRFLVERDTAFFQAVLSHIVVPGTVLDPMDVNEPERYELIGMLIDNLFGGSPDLDSLVVDDKLDFVVTLLLKATWMVTDPKLVVLKKKSPPPNFITGKLSVLSKYAPQVALAFVDAHWGVHPDQLGKEMLEWIVQNVAVDQWNVPEKGLAARGLNLLWTARRYDVICFLIKAGVDCTVPGKAWGGPDREGVHSGYAQPLTHVLGKLLKPISLLNTPGGKNLTDPVKVQGSADIVDVIINLPKPPPIMLNFKTIATTELVLSFEILPGMIWGFEDIRFPFILAARDKKHGQWPLRMLDMWAAVGPLVDPKAYPDLLANPATVIAKAVADGVKVLLQQLQAKPYWHEGIKESEFIPNFEKMCTEFLHFFAASRPYGAFMAGKELTGKDSTKRLATYACTIGLHWSAKKGLPVYYCLDGLNMQDVVDYKRYKKKEIEAYLSSLNTPTTQLLNHGPFLEVITLAEVREIVRKWKDLKNVVRFVEKGVVMSESAAEAFVLKLQDDMKVSENGQSRTWSPTTTFEQEVMGLMKDSAFWTSVPVGVRWKCVKEDNAIKLATENVEGIGLLLKVLKEDCPTLRKLGLIPDEFVRLVEVAVNADPTSRTAALTQMYDVLDTAVCEGLRQFLGSALVRHLGRP